MNALKLMTVFVAALAALLVTPSAEAKEKKGTVTVRIRMQAPPDAKRLRLWIPYAMSDGNQDISGINITGTYSAIGVYKDPHSDSALLYAEWNEAREQQTLTYTFHANRREVTTEHFPKDELSVSEKEFAAYLDNSWLGTTAEKISAEASKITKGKKTVLAKARAIYDWVVDNMRRDPDAKACGLCDVERLLTEKMGKCADVHTVFVALCRAAGVPARDIWGIRMPKEAEGDMTKMQHCWAEFYLPGHGWVPVDAADVHKVVFNRKLSPNEAKKLPERDYFFGNIDEKRIQLGYAHGVLNPPQSGPPLVYFMYPYAEADGRRLGEDINHNFGYTIEFHE